MGTALHAAAMGGHLDVCRSLVRAGACTSVKNRDLQTPADLALTNTQNSPDSALRIRDFLALGENQCGHADCGLQGRSCGHYRERVYHKGESVLLSSEIRQGRMYVRYLRSANSCPPRRSRSSMLAGKRCSRSRADHGARV